MGHKERFVQQFTPSRLEWFASLSEQGEQLLGELEGLSGQQVHEKVKEFVKAQKLKGGLFAESIRRWMKQVESEDRFRLCVDQVSLEELLSNVLDPHRRPVHFFQIPLPEILPVTVSDRTAPPYLWCDVAQVQRLLFNTIALLMQSHGQTHPLSLTIERAKLVYGMSDAPESVKEVDAVKFTFSTDSPKPPPEGETIYHMQLEPFPSAQSTRDGAMGIENQHILEAHYGWMDSEHTEEHSTYIYVLPENILELRSEEIPMEENLSYGTLETELFLTSMFREWQREGLQQGLKQGEARVLEIAQALLKQGVELKTVQTTTGLSVNQLERLET